MVRLPLAAIGLAFATLLLTSSFLAAQISGSVPINWDPGTSETGTEIASSSGVVSGDFLFRINPQTPSSGAWRTILNVEEGSADLYIKRSGYPNPAEQEFITWRSTRTGSDDEAIVLPSFRFTEGQEWYILVRCIDARWSLFSGELFVRDLGDLDFEDSNSNETYESTETVLPDETGDLTFGPEGYLFFRTEVPDGSPAWSLSTTDSDVDLYVLKGSAALDNVFDLHTEGQLLVVPGYLQASSGGSAYFVTMQGVPGETVALTSAISSYTAAEFESTTVVSSPTGGYTTIQFQVPPNQIAWEVQLVPSDGDPNLCLRRDQVPSDLENNAISEAEGTIVDSVTLSPSYNGGFGLSDGTFYVTVYSEGPFTAELTSGEVTVDPIAFEDVLVNSLPDKAGWHYYLLDDLDSQIGLGWELLLSDHVEGTEIAVRRNAIPSRWQYRTSSSGELRNSEGNLDRSIKGDLLQLPRHQKDIWYVGVYLPKQALGPYTLTSRKIAPSSLSFNGSAFVNENHDVGVVKYYRVDVPFDAEGWNLIVDQIRDAEGGSGDAVSTIAIAKDALPTMNNQELFRGPPLNHEDPPWVTGGTWYVSRDWTEIERDNDGSLRYSLFIPMGRPLQGGTYYVGILPSAINATYQIRNQGVGYGDSWQIPIEEVSLEETGSSYALSDLPLGDLRVLKMSLPEGIPSRTFELKAFAGDGFMAVKRGGIASSRATERAVIASNSGALYRSLDDEFVTLLPHSGQEGLIPGDYFFTIVSQGTLPPAPTDENADPEPYLPANLELQNAGPLAVDVLGEVPAGGIAHHVEVEGGRLLPIDFTVPSEGVVAVQINSTLETGSGGLSWWQGPTLRTPEPVTFDGRFYGFDGGEDGSSRNDDEISTRFFKASRLTLPLYSTETIGATFRTLVRATPGADLLGEITIDLFGSQELPFDSDTAFSVSQQQKGDWRYFEIVVPEDAPIAWSIDIESIEDIDNDTSRKGRVTAILRRDQAPPGGPSASLQSQTWPSGSQYVFGKDWTEFEDNPDGTKHLAAVLPLGRPLEPGRYFLGIQAVDGDVAYKVRTRGIGEGFQIPVTDVPYEQDFLVQDLAPREVRYFRVDVPEGTPNWVLQSRAVSPGDGVRLVLSKNEFVGSVATTARSSSAPHGAIVSRTDYPSATDFEENIILPTSGIALEASTYYIAVVSEGSGAAGTAVGTNLVTVEMLQPGPLPVTDLGEFIVGNDRPLVPFSLSPGGTGLFKLTIPEDSLELGLAVRGQTGNLSVHHLTGAQEGIPRPAPVSAPEYGVEGGRTGLPVDYTGICQIIGSGTHYFAARALKNEAKEWIPASGEIGMSRCTDLIEMDASKGFASGSLTQGAWDFRLLEIPEGPDAWELIAESWFFDEALNLAPGDMSVVIRRNRLPTAVSSTVRESDEVFPPGGTYWANQQSDWTQLERAADNSTMVWSVLPMGKPLEPGYYVVGIYCKSSFLNWTMRSCLIGNGFDVPITELPFSGDSAITETLVAGAKTAHYYKVTVPSDTRSWQLGVNVTRGDWSVALRYGGLPGSRSKGFQRPGEGHGFLLDKGGSEHFLLLPEPEPTTPPAEGEEPWEPYIKAGDYYIALASKGATPSLPRVGVEASEGSLFSEGTIPVESIGMVSESGLSYPLEIDGGKNVFLEFNVPVASPALEIRLDGRAGNPEFALWTGNDNTVPRPPSKTDTYGFLGGEVDQEHRFEANTIHTFTNVAPGNYRLVARASKFNNGYPSGSATLKISQKQNIPLAFGPVLETSEVLSHHRATLGQGQKNVYEISIPEDYDGQSMLGWLLTLKQFQGSGTTLKVFHQEGGSNPEVKVTDQNTLLLAPPWWRPGRTWFLSVEANTITDYEISSGPVETEGTWTMPNAFGEVFGTVGVEEEAAEVSEDEWRFYAIDVPEDNLGLLRTFLTAVSGSPDVYIREGDIPTTDHRSSSQSSGAFLYDHQLTGSGSSYGNWVTSDSKFEQDLDGGTYYLGVRANNNQNARYRLEASTGTVDPLNLQGGSVTDVNLTGGDWRYYYVDIPEELGHWTPLFTRTQGDARLYVRDTAPPGFGATPANILTDATDGKNLHAVYNGIGFEPGMIEYPFPPIRPGSRYFVGIHGQQDSTFSLESSFAERTDITPIPLAFRNGFFEGAIPPHSEIIFQVEVPFGASKWEHTSVHSEEVEVRVDQGSLPPPHEVILNTSIIQVSSTEDGYVGEAVISPQGWPLIDEKDYYVVARNNSDTPEMFSIALNGELPTEEDNDGDGLPDLWETQHFSSISAFSVTDDADGDGISNLIEFALDLSPSQATSFQHEAVQIDIQDGALVMTVNKATGFDTTHLIYTVEASYDSKVWNTTETTILTDNPQQLIVADTIPIADAELRFLRLRVTMGPR